MDVSQDDPNLANHAPSETKVVESRPQQAARFRSNY